MISLFFQFSIVAAVLSNEALSIAIAEPETMCVTEL